MILQHEAIGQTARFERYIAELLYVIAGEKKIDENMTPRFSELIENLYKNPFKAEKKKEMQTAAEIKGYLLRRIRETRDRLEAEEQHGPDETGC